MEKMEEKAKMEKMDNKKGGEEGANSWEVPRGGVGVGGRRAQCRSGIPPHSPPPQTSSGCPADAETHASRASRRKSSQRSSYHC